MAEVKTKDGLFIGLVTEENRKLLFPEEEPKEEKPAKKKAARKPKK